MVDIFSKSLEFADIFQYALHNLVFRDVLQADTAFRYVFQKIFQNVFQNFNTGIESLRAFFQNQTFFTDFSQFFRNRNVFSQNIPAVDGALHPFCEKMQEFLCFFVAVQFQFLVLRVVKSQSHAQYQQRGGNTAAGSALAHTASETGADFKCSF